MTSRLATIAPDLDQTITQAAPATQRAIAIAAAEYAIQRTQLTGPEVDAGLTAARDGRFGDTPERTGIHALAERLDEQQWAIQDRLDAGQATEEEHLAAFSTARAATALYYALDADAPTATLEAAYEANAATDELAELQTLVARTIDQR